MTKDDLCAELKDYKKHLDIIRNQISQISTLQISDKALLKDIETLSETWFQYSQQLLAFGLDSQVLNSYDNLFKRFLRLVGKPNRTTSYATIITAICKSFREEIIVYLQTAVLTPAEDVMQFGKVVEELLCRIPDKNENEYLREALGCWKNGYLKASVVLLWCAGIDRVHKAIEQMGFSDFNKAADMMRLQTKGRFKNFNKSYNVQTLSELQMVFDNDILWILEGMGLIDSNQKTRLSSCFDMRCHAGHPGAAPITEYNVLSCFSDIIEIILANPAFSVNPLSE